MSLLPAACDQRPAEALVVEQRLDDDDAVQQPGELQHDHGEGRDQRVAQRVRITTSRKRTPFSRAVRMYCCGHHLGHRGAGHPGDIADAVERDGHHRQGEVPEGDLVHRAGGGALNSVLPSIQPFGSSGECRSWLGEERRSAPRPRHIPASRSRRWRRSTAPGPAREPSRMPDSTPMSSDVGHHHHHHPEHQPAGQAEPCGRRSSRPVP